MMLHSHEQGVQENTQSDERIKERKIDNLFQDFLNFDKGGVGFREAKTALAVPLVKRRFFVLLHVYTMMRGEGGGR